jgi:hypothetical protein
MAITEYRAERLAELAQLDLALPAPARTAISGYQAVMAQALPPPPQPGAAQRAITALADQLARDALCGKHPAAPPLPLDVTPVAAARQDEEAARDRTALARELRASAAAVLCQVFYGDTGQQAIRAVQARHAETMAELCHHARQVPEGTDDQGALEAGGEVRVSYLAARDLAMLVTRLREAVQLIEDRTPAIEQDGLLLTLMFERSGRLHDTWLAPAGTSSHGALGSFGFYMSACREPAYEWWCPVTGDVEGRADELLSQRHADRVSGLPAAPPRMRAPSVF